MKKLIHLGFILALASTDVLAGPINTQLDSTITVRSCKYKHTGNTFDLALINRGYFLIGRGAYNKAFYTRYGNFGLNNDGMLISTNGGDLVLGITYNGEYLNPMPIKIPTDTLKPKPTSEIEQQVNLPSFSAVDKTYSVSNTIYDAMGGSHSFRIDYFKTKLNSWNLVYQIDEINIATGQLQFNKDGTLNKEYANPKIEWLADTGMQTINLDLSEITQYTIPFSINKAYQNGYTSGGLSRVHVTADGEIGLTYNNGVTTYLEQRIAIATFKHPEQLTEVIERLYAANADSGEADFQFFETSGNFLVGYLEEQYCLPE